MQLSASTSRRLGHLFTYVVLTALSVVVLFPLFWMVSTSLKTLDQITVFPPIMFPENPAWENYPAALTFQPFGLFARNTLVITVMYIIGNLLSSSLVAYGFARLRFPGRRVLFTLMLSTLMMPLIIRLVPLFLIFRSLGWVNTPLPLVVPAFFGEAFYIFLMYQFYRNIPQDLLDAARIDGASEMRIWWRIMIPLSKPALITVIIFSFQHTWNDFLAPLIFLTRTESWTLSLGLVAFTAGAGEAVAYWHWLMAASTTMVVPMIIIFLFAQRHFIGSAISSGVKG
jgi:multiple sugar transport system permease protein